MFNERLLHLLFFFAHFPRYNINNHSQLNLFENNYSIIGSNTSLDYLLSYEFMESVNIYLSGLLKTRNIIRKFLNIQGSLRISSSKSFFSIAHNETEVTAEFSQITIARKEL